MPNYSKFEEFLKTQNDSINLKFSEIENIIGKLTSSAYEHKAWWSNSLTHPLMKEVLEAGWRSSNINLKEKTVSFYKGTSKKIKTKKNNDPTTSYTALLHSKGLNEILKKIGEESTETIIAAKSDDNEDLVYEIADLWFHCLILLSEKNLKVEHIIRELKRRSGTSGIEEKNSRKIK